MTTFTEQRYPGEFIVREAGMRSRDVVTLLAGNNLDVGTVLGRQSIGSAAVGAARAGNTGTGAIGAIAIGAGVKRGVYTVTVIEPASNGGAFTVEDPDGVAIAVGHVGVAFANGGIGFTVSDGGLDFVAGDQFTIAVPDGSGKYGALDLVAIDGLSAAAGVLHAGVDATAGDKSAIAVTRACEVRVSKLIWPAGITGDQKAAALVQLSSIGVLAR